jgi:hypothetical protein
MSHSIRPTSRSIPILGALAIAILSARPAPVRAEAIWSADAAVINAANPGAAPGLGSINLIGNNTTFSANFAWGVTLANGNAYTATGTFTEITRPIGLQTRSALIAVNNFTITANAFNVGNIADTMWFFSDVFPLTGAGLPGYVGMSGAFASAPGQVGGAQAQMNFNQVFGNVGSFLTTLQVSNGGLGGVSPFLVLNRGIIPNQVNELTGLLAFSLAPGQSLTLPFDFSDNVDLASVLPEPNSIVLLALGVIPLAFVARRKLRRPPARTSVVPGRGEANPAVRALMGAASSTP